jgi:hypothetical protein
MSTIFSSDSWISSAWNVSSPGAGIMGALQSSSTNKYPPGSLKAYINNNSVAANALATITSGGTTDLTTLAMQAGDLAYEKLQQERAKLFAKFVTPPPPPVTLDPFIYFDDGSTLDTVNNVITMVSGKKINAVTGADWVDPASIVNLANGSYIDTANNIMYMPDGSKIDTVTGLVISTSA